MAKGKKTKKTKKKKTKKTTTKAKAETNASVIGMQEFMSRRLLGEIERVQEGLADDIEDLLLAAEEQRQSYLEDGGLRTDRVIRSMDRVAAKIERQRRDGVMVEFGDLDLLRDRLTELEESPRHPGPRAAGHGLLQTPYPQVYIRDTDVLVSVDLLNAISDTCNHPGDSEGLLVQLLREVCYSPWNAGIPPHYWTEAPFTIADELATRYHELGCEARTNGDAEVRVVDEAGTEHCFRVENAHTLDPDHLRREDARHPAGWSLAVPSRYEGSVPALPNLTHLILWKSWPYVTDDHELDIRIDFGDLPTSFR